MSPVPSQRPGQHEHQADRGRVSAAQSPAGMFILGLAHSIPFVIILVPFGLLFGVIALEAGIDLLQIMGFSVLVLAGASQFTAVQLISDNAPVWLVIVSGLTINLRMAMYSASLVPWLRGAGNRQRLYVAYVLIDQTYALAIQHYERHPRLELSQRLAYFFGSATATCLSWIVSCLAGAVIGRAIPDSAALDFALPICFLAMIGPMLRTIPHVVACFVAVLMSLLLAGLPSGSGMLVAAPFGMVAGAIIEWLIEKRRAGQP